MKSKTCVKSFVYDVPKNIRGQFKDHISHMCLAGTVVALWPPMQEVADLNLFHDKYFSTFSKNIRINKFIFSTYIWRLV